MVESSRAGQYAFLKTLGPGLIMAGAAVGVSHLVQATRAGAEYGYLLIGLVLLTCLLKFPFLEFGPRYAAATGESLLDGYRRLGRWAITLYALITFGTMFVILASVTLVTAGLAARIFGPGLSTTVWAALVLAACGLILLLGRFRGLDLSMKLIMAALALITLVAVTLALASPAAQEAAVAAPPLASLWNAAAIGFLLALMGWMPIPLDVAAWHSIWTLERRRQSGHQPSLSHALLDFRIGYIGATLLAVGFLILGAVVMFGSGSRFSDNAVQFSSQFAQLYGSVLGDWSVPVILAAALVVMFSTTLAVSDAYPRVLSALSSFLRPSLVIRAASRRLLYLIFFLAMGVGALSLISLFGKRLTTLIDFATTVSFLSAPVLAWLNYRLVCGEHMPVHARPGRGLRLLSLLGIVFLCAFCAVWLGWRLMA
ncbi:NRAMP family divalent metal transporter [Natronospira bacteriovora]|uniref:Divalent metal cation transporter n=1 Tax=Natronospira bacteriovora TaxID=3069753 RepID=A0ABU0W906_9GAMM|nr:divalent metal cation transporter [Natronospira sp. AB-CW4]MDQ2070243.1 divalent metal cation transporter [Natronospira sp. AB-CW4]